MKVLNRMTISNLIILLYLATVFLISTIPFRSWTSLSFGLILGSAGSLAAYILLRQWETSLKQSGPMPAPLPNVAIREDPFYSEERFKELELALSEAHNRHENLIAELSGKEEALRKMEAERAQCEQKIEEAHRELQSIQSTSEEELRRKSVLLSEYQETINQQREVIKKKQEFISELESKVRDLNYEVKTLLQLAELGNKQSNPHAVPEGEIQLPFHLERQEEQESAIPAPPRLHQSPEGAAAHLKRCIDIAQKISGSGRFSNNSSRFKDIPIDNYALDLRRLFDTLRCENTSTVIVYSPKENKLLFANNQTLNLLGWNAEKFINGFFEIIAEGSQEWKKGINALSKMAESKARLLMKTKSGENILIHCHLGIIPTGAFRGQVIGVLYPA